MKKLFILLRTIAITPFMVSLCFAETPNHIKKLTPKGWNVLYFSEGDLNQDNQADIAMILEKQKPDIVIKNEEGRVINNNARLLLVLFKDQSTYKPIAKNTTLPLAERENSCLVDPLGETDGLVIKNGTLTVDFNYFMSCGSWEWPRHYYTFRWQNNDFKLIGFDYHSLHRATGDENSKSYNFSTSKVKTTTVVDKQDNDGTSKTTWSKFTYPKVFSLKEINFEDFYEQFNY